MRAISLIAVLALAGAAMTAVAQIRVQAGGTNVSIGADGGVNVQESGSNVSVGGKGKGRAAVAGGGNTAGNTVGGIEGDVESEGVTIINGRVYIDGKEIPPKVTRYKSPRTGEVYVIRRKGTSVEVVSEEDRK